MGRAKSKGIDWEAIFREYRAGQLSIREIARRYRVDHAYLHRKAKKEGWTRDLTEKVKRAVIRKLVTSSVSSPYARDKEIIEAEADKIVAVQQLHRTDIKHQREIAAGLLSDLEENKSQKVVTKDGVEVEVYASLKERSEIFRNLTQAAAKYIPLERQAWSLDKPGGGESPDASLDRVLKAIDGKTLDLVSPE